jgi:hypothetical protein
MHCKTIVSWHMFLDRVSMLEHISAFVGVVGFFGRKASLCSQSACIRISRCVSFISVNWFASR